MMLIEHRVVLCATADVLQYGFKRAFCFHDRHSFACALLTIGYASRKSRLRLCKYFEAFVCGVDHVRTIGLAAGLVHRKPAPWPCVGAARVARTTIRLVMANNHAVTRPWFPEEARLLCLSSGGVSTDKASADTAIGLRSLAALSKTARPNELNEWETFSAAGEVSLPVLHLR